MNCYNCNTKLIWGGDHDIDDSFQVDDEVKDYNMTTNLSCPKCEALVLIYHKKPTCIQEEV
jgi:hypothetical protein|tara:strand:+ start:178 stop:360 length:183 start_codon:yes stop_codon:yes gene_type:complete